MYLSMGQAIMYDDAIFGSFKVKNFIETRVNYPITSELKDELMGDNAYMSVYVTMDDERKELIRRTFTLSDAFAKVGGFMTIIFLIT